MLFLSFFFSFLGLDVTETWTFSLRLRVSIAVTAGLTTNFEFRPYHGAPELELRMKETQVMWRSKING